MIPHIHDSRIVQILETLLYCVLTCTSLIAALDKTKLAEELADELDMKYIPGVSMEDFYINAYGFDIRELDHLYKYPR